MLKIGVVGAGHLGKIHLRLLNQSDKYQLIGFHDLDKENAEKTATEFGYIYFERLADMLAQIDVLDIVTPTFSHFEYAKLAINHNKHFFVEKPVTSTLAQVDELISMMQGTSLKAQVGHVERFNPAFIAAKNHIKNPMFLEIHRLAEFNPRGTDVPVVLDLMIHDIDIVLSVIDSKVVDIKSSGIAIISDTPDIANARVQFENGCVANFTTSRISMKNMRKIRFFQKNAYVSVDFLDKKTEIIRMQNPSIPPNDFGITLENAEGKKKEITFDLPEIEPNNAILDELESFATAINNDRETEVPITDGRAALDIALQIIANFNQV